MREWTLETNNQLTALPDEIGDLRELAWVDARLETGDWT